MNTKVLSLILGLAAIASLGSLYLSQTNHKTSSFEVSDLSLYSYLDADELHYRVSLFKDWAATNNKQYSSIEATRRFYAWNKNYEFVQDHNSKNLSWTVEMNKFADLLSEEFASLYLGYNAHHYNLEQEAQKVEILDELNVPSSVDWRTKGAVTSIKDQAQCGGCYAFASVAGLESLYFIKNQALKALSPQQIIDCSGSFGNQGCNGGLMTSSYNYIKSKGIESNTDYAYKGAASTCKYASAKAFRKNSGYSNVAQNSYTQLKAAVANQPVPVAVEADQSVFQLYKSGVVSSGCGTSLDHAITIVGYSTSGASPYWIVRNQWGTNWGDKGYIKIAMGSENGGMGVCGINQQATYPTL